MPLNLKVHEYRKLPNSDRVVLAGVWPYMCLCEHEKLPIFVQEGQFFDQSGRLMKEGDVPDWAKAQLENVSDDAKRDVGIIKPEPPEPSPSLPKAAMDRPKSLPLKAAPAADEGAA